MDGKRIKSITTLSGKTYRGKMFIDATYVGDLMAAAGVTYTVGREPESQYGEDMAGVRRGDTKPRVHYGQSDKDHFVEGRGSLREARRPEQRTAAAHPPASRASRTGRATKRSRPTTTASASRRIPTTASPSRSRRATARSITNCCCATSMRATRDCPRSSSRWRAGQKVDWNNMHAVGSDYPGGELGLPGSQLRAPPRDRKGA